MMKLEVLYLAFVLVAAPVSAAPMEPVRPADIKGRVNEWVWRAGIQYVEENGNGSYCSVSVPAHYLVVLDVDRGDRKLLATISAKTRWLLFQHEVMDKTLATNQVLLIIVSDRIQEMKDGARLALDAYTITGDEFSVVPTYKQITLDGKVPTPAAPRGPANTTERIDSKSEPPAAASAGGEK